MKGETRIVGSVSSLLAHDNPRPGMVASILLDRGLQSGKLDEVQIDELQLAYIVAQGGEILARLAGDRRLAEVSEMGRPA